MHEYSPIVLYTLSFKASDYAGHADESRARESVHSRPITGYKSRVRENIHKASHSHNPNTMGEMHCCQLLCMYAQFCFPSFIDLLLKLLGVQSSPVHFY